MASGSDNWGKSVIRGGVEKEKNKKNTRRSPLERCLTQPKKRDIPRKNGYTTWKVDGAIPMHRLIIAPY